MNKIGKQNGIILITAIFIVLLIATLGIGYLALVNNQLELANITLKSAKAFYCAEVGIAKAVLKYDTLEEGENPPEDWGEKGRYQVVVTLVNGFEKTIESTGSWDGFRRIISVKLDKPEEEIIQQEWEEI